MSQKPWLAAKCFTCGKTVEQKDALVIDEDTDLIFCSEEHLYQHYAKPIEDLEKEYLGLKGENDIPQEGFAKYGDCLNDLLEEPDEIWEDSETVSETAVHQYIGEFSVDEQPVYYVAVVRMTNTHPSFVFLHFPTKDLKLVEHYRRGRLIYDKAQSEIQVDSGDADALSEGDEFAIGLYQAMLALRNPTDIQEEDFPKFLELRQETIEEADEIWKSTDLLGNTLVSFIKEFSTDDGDGHYIVVTIEDVVASTHFILFSFPSNDPQLVERYRQGESLSSETEHLPQSH